MQPEIHVLGLPLRTFGLALAFAFLSSGALVARRLSELGRPPELAYGMTLAAAIGGIVGSRVYYLIQHASEVASDPLGSIFGGSGLVFYGGLVGGAIGVVAWAWRRGMLGLGLMDLTAPAIAIGYAFGRIGCQLSGDGDYGTPSDLPWAMAYPHGTVPIDIPVHPTPIYETLAMGLVTWLLWSWRGRLWPGLLFACYLGLAGLERFLIEFIRRNDAVLAGLTTAQLESLALIAIAMIWLAWVRRRAGSWRAPPARLASAASPQPDSIGA